LNELSLLLAIRKEITAQNSEQDRFVLADTTHLLSQLEEGDTSFVFENTGSFTKHIMIDEFQDTSRLQWKNLRLLLIECLSQNKECLVVGDVKQSIYRWRNGDWNILNTGIEQEMSIYNPKTITLNTNFRSHSRVIEFNNLFFPIAQSYLSEVYKGTFTTEHPSISGAYSDVCQQSNKKGCSGYICLELHNNKSLDDETALMPGIIAEHLDRLTLSGVNQGDITILTRRNKDIAQICSWFAENRPEYRMVSDEAFYMETSPALRIIINAMRYISNPTDNISLAALAIEWNRYVKQRTISFEDILQESITSNIPSAFLEWVEKATHLPLYEMAENLYSILEIGNIENQDAYLFSFFDRLRLFTQKKSNTLSMFIEEWDNTLHKKPIAMGHTDSIRLMTIHKSKGLEFHTVILPYCNWQVESNSKLWVEPENEPFNKLPLLPIECTSSLKESVFSNDYKEEYSDTLVDNLNLLYVAFTRAEANLIVLGQTKGKKNGFNTYDILTYFAEGQTETEHNEHIISYVSGEIISSNKTEKKRESQNPLTADKELQSINMCHYPLSTRFKQSTESMRYMADITQENSKTETYIERGKLLHRLFSTINTAKDIDRETDRMLAEGLIESRKSAESIKQFIHKAIDKPEVKYWFDGNYKLLNETSILFRENGTTQKRIPDRVMINGSKATVVDFKFGKEHEAYLHQVEEYISLLQQMGFTDVEGYIWYVYNNKTIKC
jgi:ATP-dependent exoDNAse (exonuclease V) beta subunit